jgi:hypothetical protein
MLLWSGIMFLAAVLCPFIGGRRCRSARLALLFVSFSFCILAACSNLRVLDAERPSQLTVFTIRATSSEGPMATVHSTQVLLNLK